MSAKRLALLAALFTIAGGASATDRQIPSGSTPRKPLLISLSGEWREDGSPKALNYRVEIENQGMQFSGTAMVENDRELGLLVVRGKYFQGGGFDAEVLRSGAVISRINGIINGETFVASTEDLDASGAISQRRTGSGRWNRQGARVRPLTVP